MAARTRKTAMNFKPMRQAEVPQGRNGKHKAIVTRILSDLDRIAEGIAAEGAVGAVDGQQGTGQISAEPRHAQGRARRRHGNRRRLLVRLE